MKKIFIILFVFCYPIVANAQNVEVDKVESDGTRFIRTDYSSIYKKMFSGGSIALCCDYNSQSNDTTYYIIMKLTEQNPPQIDKGRKLLVKLNNGAIITLENATKIGPLDIETWKGAYNMVEYRVNQCTKYLD